MSNSNWGNAFKGEFNKVAWKAYEIAESNGFNGPGIEHNDGQTIALIHSELSEALEAIRDGNPPDDKIPEYSGAEAELADVIIRIMDAAYSRGWDVAGAIIAKMDYNETRTYKHGGKAF